MNINTYNYGHYRLTDYGRGKYQLFNRDTDYVCTPTEEEFRSIMNAEDKQFLCKVVEGNHLRVKAFVA
jgi:hypothetical protein